MASDRYLTTDHDRIRGWAEDRDGTPSAVSQTGGGDDPGIIRIDFPGYSGEGSLEPISWDEWYRKFDDNDLVFLFQDRTGDGEKSNFSKLLKRETAEGRDDAEWV